jgi:hypothetical protein
MRRLAPTALLIALLGLAAAPTPAADDLKALRETVLKALDEKDPLKRAQAFLPLQAARDPKALEIVVEAQARAAGLLVKVREAQAKTEESYEKSINDMLKLERAFEEKNDQSPRATEAFNKAERKISREREKALADLRNLENDYVRAVALSDAAVATAGVILGALEGEARIAGLDLLERLWLRAPQGAHALKFVDAVGGLTGDEVARRLADAAADGTLPIATRAAAVRHLGHVRDGRLPECVLGHLNLPPDSFLLVEATITALRLTHRKSCIAPLIEFLGRTDLGRLREDAHAALSSLTGQTHGPYKEPWATWWKDAEAGFVMPPDPTPHSTTSGQGKGVTFYGITTFSDRILFVLDVSGSMDKPDTKDRPGVSRMEVARKELLGALFNVGDGNLFNVLLFNHEVLPWQPNMVTATEELRRKAKEWVEPRTPIGGTNIHDALEAAFQVALRVTGKPLVDTVFFLTDGTPTAGKLQDPQQILAAVREWNRSARLTLHCIAVGEADHAFLEELAKIGNGTFLKR